MPRSTKLVHLDCLGPLQSLERITFDLLPPNQRHLSPPDSPEQTIILPKRVSDVLDLFRECQKGFRRAWWVELPLNPHEYDLLWDSLRKDDDLFLFVVDRLRYVKGLLYPFGLVIIPILGMFGRFDWSPQDSTISVRMPTLIHNIFTEMVAEEIRSQLRDFKREHTETAAIVNKLTSETTSDVYLHGHGPVDGRLPKRLPDAFFAHTESQYPFIVIKTSYSRRQKDLARLADDYICGSNGNINVILAGSGHLTPSVLENYQVAVSRQHPTVIVTFHG